MARRHTPAKFKPGSCQRLRHTDAQVIPSPERYWQSLAGLPRGAFAAMRAAELAAAQIEQQYRTNGTCQVCHTARSNTGACWR